MRITLSQIVAVVACLALAPVAYSKPLRFFYQQWIAAQLAKVRSPQLVVIGDSIAAGGGGFGRIDTINLASNGQELHQIAAYLPRAQSFRPNYILVDGGVNDAIQDGPDYGRIRTLWRSICAAPNVIATLPTPTRNRAVNARLEPMRTIIRAECAHVLDLPMLAGTDGLLRSEYSIDGVHLRSAAYGVWRAQLRQHLR